jgi:2-polyprenyl-3-methyl-5-hydroxy-6-metoxy-1,4-benzoquinol methylase
MQFDYERDTRTFYQDEATAQRYHEMYMSRSGWRNLPSRVVARCERRVVKAMLERVPHRSVLDIPAGTGKLAGVFASLGSRVLASDISPSMLKRAEAEFSRVGHPDVSFQVADAAFDVAVCLRLMHRVPPGLRARMLKELARVAPHAIISYGIENGFHKLRRKTRAAIFGGQNDALCFCRITQALAELQPHFDIVAKTWIARTLSQELIFLLRSKPHHAEDGG